MTIPELAQVARSRLIHDNEVPPLPNEWAVERFRFLFRESKDRNGNQPVGEMLSVSEYRGVVLKDYDHEERRRTGEDLQTYRVVRPGQLAVNTMWLNHLGLGVSEHLGHVSPAYAVYDISNRLDTRFAHHLLRSQYYLKIYLRYLYGIRPNSFQIKTDDWKSIPIIVPPFNTQKAIANFLDHETGRIDQLIDKKQQMVELLAEKRGVVALKCLSKGLVCFDWISDKQSVACRFNEESWSEMRVKNVVGFMTSGSRAWSNLISAEGEVFIQSGNIGRRMEVDLRYTQRVQPQTGAEADRTLVKKHDVLVCITGGRTGAVGFIRTIDERAYVNQHVCLLRARRGIILPELLAQILWSEIGQKQIELCQYGLKQGLGFGEVANIRLPVPPSEQQPSIISEIAASTDRLDAATEVIEQSLDRLREFRSALITAAVTGQIDIATWGNRGTTDSRLDDIEAEMAGAAPPRREKAQA